MDSHWEFSGRTDGRTDGRTRVNSKVPIPTKVGGPKTDGRLSRISPDRRTDGRTNGTVNYNPFPTKVGGLKRCEGIKRKMVRDQSYHSDYVEFMNRMMEKGYAVHAPDNEKGSVSWFMPHHGVYHPANGNICVVFDCAASKDGKSLNSELLSGPNQTRWTCWIQDARSRIRWHFVTFPCKLCTETNCIWQCREILAGSLFCVTSQFLCWWSSEEHFLFTCNWDRELRESLGTLAMILLGFK